MKKILHSTIELTWQSFWLAFGAVFGFFTAYVFLLLIINITK